MFDGFSAIFKRDFLGRFRPLKVAKNLPLLPENIRRASSFIAPAGLLEGYLPINPTVLVQNLRAPTSSWPRRTTSKKYDQTARRLLLRNEAEEGLKGLISYQTLTMEAFERVIGYLQESFNPLFSKQGRAGSVGLWTD